MDDSAVQAAAQILVSHWQAGTRVPALPERCRPRSRGEGYAIQRAVQALSGQALFGWKIAATSSAGQTHIGVDGPLAGRVLSNRVRQSRARLSCDANFMRVAEPEFAFRMAHDLPPRRRPYPVPEVLEAVGSVHPAIEVPDSRYQDFAHVGAAQLIADNACAHYFVLGEATEAHWRELDLVAHAVRAEVEGRYRRDGGGENVLGDPRAALAWLVNELSALGETLGAGQVVTTGTCMTPLEIQPGDHVLADFGVLGHVEVVFDE